jgi:hypothetical protein
VAQAVSRRPFTVEARKESQASLCVIYGAQSGTGADFPPISSVSHRCPIHVFILLVLKAEGEAGEAWENFQKSNVFSENWVCHLGSEGLINQRYSLTILGCRLVNKG